MPTEVITRIAEYALTKRLDKYHWQKVYEKCRNDILSVLEKQDDDRCKLIAEIFGNKRIKEFFCALDIKVGYGFSEGLRKKLYDIFRDYEINELEKNIISKNSLKMSSTI